MTILIEQAHTPCPPRSVKLKSRWRALGWLGLGGRWVLIRRHEPRDDGAVAHNAARMFGGSIPPWVVEGMASSYYSAPSSLSLVAEVEGDGRIVAHAYHVAEFGLNVLPEWGGQGLGGALLESFLDWAERNPYLPSVALRVGPTHDAAIPLYVRHGFQIEAVADGWRYMRRLTKDRPDAFTDFAPGNPVVSVSREEPGSGLHHLEDVALTRRIYPDTLLRWGSGQYRFEGDAAKGGRAAVLRNLP